MMNLEKLDDRLLLKCYRRGDNSALGVLLRRHKNKIYQKIYLIIRDKVTADDLLQDTFIRIMNSVRSVNYNEEGKFLPWALTVAKNLCFDHKRKMKCPKHYRFSLPENLSRYSTTIKCRISEEQLQQQIESMLNKLTEVQKTVIKYRHFEEMSYKEISLAMGTSINTATGRMRYALINLNRLIGENRGTFMNA